jgi:hypothetical protein
MNLFPTRRPSALLGLAWSEDQLHLTLVHRARGTITVGPGFTLPFAAAGLAPADPVAAGADLRAQLLVAGCRPRACVAAVPPGWIMAATVLLPDLAPADLPAFVELTAERKFPCPPEELQITRSLVRVGPVTLLTLLAVRKTSLDLLARLLTAAGLKPLGLTFALPLLDEVAPTGNTGSLTLVLDQQHSTLLGLAGGGLALLRSLDPLKAHDSTGSLVRELRVSWEQLPAAVRTSITTLRLLGDAALIDLAATALKPWSVSVGATVTAAPAAGLGAQRSAAVARQWLAHPAQSLQFLPPQPSRWQRLFGRYSSRKLRGIGLAVAALIVIGLGSLAWQAVTLWQLRDRWAAMSPAVGNVQALQANIRQFRSWTDSSPQNLTILRLVSEAFPRTGVVTARSFAIRGTSAVSITGTTTDSAALLHALDNLRKLPDISNLKLEQIRGSSPAQFTFKFNWRGSPGS